MSAEPPGWGLHTSTVRSPAGEWRGRGFVLQLGVICIRITFLAWKGR